MLHQGKKSGCCGFSDDEIFGMALHYYQEDNIAVSYTHLDVYKRQRLKRTANLVAKYPTTYLQP